jgi:hypothetical protein
MFDITDKVVTLLGFPQLLDGEYAGSGESSLTSDVNITTFAEASLSANTGLTSAAIILVQGATVMSSTLTVEVSETIVYAAASIVIGESDLEATSTRLFFVTSILDSQSSLTGEPVLVNITTSRPLSGQSVLSATMFQPLNILNLPVVEYVYTDDRLLKRYGINSGQSLTITGTVGRIVEFQTGTEIEEADYYYGGGRRHVLTDTEVTAVENAGFGDLISIEGVPSGV